jgi:LDH2 family malate/lactate/ureidoglycolate dehydrogenase
LSLDAFCGRDKFLDKVHDLRADVRSSRLAPGFDTIMLPGEVELACRRRHLRNGIRIEKSLLAELKKRAREPVAVYASEL